MTLEELLIATELEDQNDARGKNLHANRNDDDNSEWIKGSTEEVKKGSDDPLKRAAKAVTSAMMQETH